MNNEDIVYLGKKEIDYDNILLKSGKIKADDNLFFWVRGFKKAKGIYRSIKIDI